MSVSVLFCRFLIATNSSHKGHKRLAGKKREFWGSGVVLQPGFLR
ncbi:hypothetical protein CLOSTHATH_00165 [Hungatella hathewayi DSM 13479]|uniref:Uncharacterized protein n=1 Tax=Hungatella hathewayi DSM 13479 TaxID=566550 RepID=D3A995_9FIRM|nr:hypothetical protein CLOSTHATH_00165 [Hungatella hathewayi DSM 13479]